MAKNSSRFKNLFSVLTVMLLFFAASSVFTGCSDDDDEDAYKNRIEICNEDDEEYQVKLHRNSDGVVIREFTLGAWYDITEDKCSNFENIDEGYYYISIHEDNSSSASDTSENFYMDNGNVRYFTIESPGKIYVSTLI